MLRRFAKMLSAWFALSLCLFTLLHLMPGRAEDALLLNNPKITRSEIAHLRALHGADRPILERYVCWLIGPRAGCGWWLGGEGILTGHLGYSRAFSRPVRSLVAERLPRTLFLTLPAFGCALLFAIAFAVRAAQRPGGVADWIARGVAMISIAAPVHWLALLAVAAFGVHLRWFPVSGVHPVGQDGLGARLHHAVLPVLVLSTLYAGRWVRYLRSSMIETLDQDFVQTAAAMGVPQRLIVWRWAFPKAAAPLVTVVTQSIPSFFSGALVIERIFAYPGMGALIFDSVERRDHLVAIVVFLGYAAITMFAIALAEGLYAILDPTLERSDAPQS